MGFQEDDRIRQIAEAYSLDAVDFARENFRVCLDFTDESIRRLEGMLQTFHEQLPQARPSKERVFQFVKMFGSYVGETFRRNHGARWGIVTLGEESFPGMCGQRSGTEFWPWGRVQNRLVNGAEDNVWQYYSVLVEKEAVP